MTQQREDILTVDGIALSLVTYPLTKVLQLDPAIKLRAIRTSLRRGYLAEWLIDTNRLYLTGLTGVTITDEPLTISMLFPNDSIPVFARWYSGELWCKESADDYCRRYEVKQGVVVTSNRQKIDVNCPISLRKV